MRQNCAEHFQNIPSSGLARMQRKTLNYLGKTVSLNASYSSNNFSRLIFLAPFSLYIFTQKTSSPNMENIKKTIYMNR
jgi:hypothetical protein